MQTLFPEIRQRRQVLQETYLEGKMTPDPIAKIKSLIDQIEREVGQAKLVATVEDLKELGHMQEQLIDAAYWVGEIMKGIKHEI